MRVAGTKKKQAVTEEIMLGERQKKKKEALRREDLRERLHSNSFSLYKFIHTPQDFLHRDCFLESLSARESEKISCLNLSPSLSLMTEITTGSLQLTKEKQRGGGEEGEARN